MAVRLAISSVSRREGAAAGVLDGVTPGAVVLALALPPLFLHASFQPSLGIGSAQGMLSDFAVAAVVVAALVEGVRLGFAPLRPGRWLWLAGIAFSAWIAIAVLYGHARFGAYPWHRHGVTAAKWYEYMLLAPAVPLLVRRRRDLELVLLSLALWSAAATIVGLAQFLGADVAGGGTFGRRQSSFLGSSDFAALSGAALLAGVVVARERRALSWLLVAAGTLGAILAGSLSGMLGIATALGIGLVALALRRGAGRRVVAVSALLAVVVAGSLAIRTADLSSFHRFLGGKQAFENRSKVQTEAQRTTLAYIGLRIWLDDPLLGVGWLGSSDPYAFEPYIPAARRRFPNQPASAFPSPARRLGVQDLYIQALADLGVVGLAALLALFGTGLAMAVRSPGEPPGSPGAPSTGPLTRTGGFAAAWLVLVLWLWTAQGFVAGIPLDALTWLAFGLAAARIPERARA